MEKIIIAAMSLNKVIGNEGKIPWKIKEDMHHFRELTIGYPVIMGRKTYESIGKPLDERINLVVTRKPEKYYEDSKSGIIFCKSIFRAFDIAQSIQKHFFEIDKKAYIIGGREIYRETLDLVDKLELTIINKNIVGDTYFPEVNWDEWKEIKRDESSKEYSFMTYVRK